MATRKYGLSRDEKYFEVTEAVGAATTDAIELTVDLDKIPDKGQLKVLLDKIFFYISERDWPPA